MTRYWRRPPACGANDPWTATSDQRDPGLQQERTSLSWQRTGLSLVIATLVLSRLSVEHLGAHVVLPTVLAVTTGLWVVISATRDHVTIRQHRDDPRFGWVLSSGTLPLAVTAVCVILALGELATALSH